MITWKNFIILGTVMMFTLINGQAPAQTPPGVVTNANHPQETPARPGIPQGTLPDLGNQASGTPNPGAVLEAHDTNKQKMLSRGPTIRILITITHTTTEDRRETSFRELLIGRWRFHRQPGIVYRSSWTTTFSLVRRLPMGASLRFSRWLLTKKARNHLNFPRLVRIIPAVDNSFCVCS